MNKLLFAGLTTLLFACNQQTEKKLLQMPDLEQQNLKGKIRQVETDNYAADSTGTIGAMDTCCNSAEEYDDNGYSIRYITKDAKGNIKTEQSFTHNDAGLFTGMTTMTDNKKTSSLTVELDKDQKYHVVRSLDSMDKMDSYYDEIVTNEFGEVTSAKQHHPDSSLKSSFTNNFEKQFYVGGESKDSTGKVTYSSSVKLNDKNDQEQVTETTVDKDSTKTTVTTYKYDGWDEQGNWTQRTTYDDKGKPTKITKRIITYADKK